MQELTECLGSRLPRVFDARITIPQVNDPVSWAIGLVRNNAEQARLQARDTSAVCAEQDSTAIVHLDPGDPPSLERFARGVLGGEPVHGSLDLLQYASNDGAVRDGADWVWGLARHYFVDALKARNPLGFYIKATLWLSAGEHHYAAHCDLADGFLVHLRGQKRVRVWPIPNRYRDLRVYNHGDFEGRMSTAPVQFDLKPGQILFIPAGAMHDVVARKQQGAAVSVSLHMGSPYPLLTLCEELNALLGFEDIAVPAHMRAREKFDIYVFEPARYSGGPQSTSDRMPEALAAHLQDMLQSRVTDRSDMRHLLDRWWKSAVSTPRYRTPYP